MTTTTAGPDAELVETAFALFLGLLEQYQEPVRAALRHATSTGDRAPAHRIAGELDQLA